MPKNYGKDSTRVGYYFCNVVKNLKNLVGSDFPMVLILYMYIFRLRLIKIYG